MSEPLSQRLRLTATMAAVPAILLAVLYAPALRASYRLDDLAWLSLRNTIENGHSLLWALFSPQAQGSIRPLGERVWFLLASSLFGLNPFPLHLLALVIQIANVVLLVAAGRRLLGSSLAAGIAATVWVVNDSLVEPMVWASAFNEILYTFWFLLAFNAFMRWIDSGKSTWLAEHLAAIVMGFGTLELMVVFPLIAAVYVALFAPRHWKAVLPSAGVAAAFVAAHLFFVRLPLSGPYRMIFGWSVVKNLAHYWTNVLGPEEYGRIHQSGRGLAVAGSVFMSAAVLLWVIAGIRRRQLTGLFCVLWFVLGLAPILPLSEHFTPYYSFVPLIGLAWLAGDAVVTVRSRWGRAVALACVVSCTFCQTTSTLFVRDWNRERSSEVEVREAGLLSAVQEIRRVQPQGPVFLDGLDTEQFWWGLCYGELTRRGYRDLHILPDAAEHGVAIPPREWCVDRNFQLSPSETALILGEGRGQAYDVTSVPPRIVPAKKR
jgi:hypothetical protein